MEWNILQNPQYRSPFQNIWPRRLKDFCQIGFRTVHGLCRDDNLLTHMAFTAHRFASTEYAVA